MNKRKIMSAILVMVMMFSLFPTKVIAEETEDLYTEEKAIAVEFLEKAAQNEWLGAENDLTKYIASDSERGQFVIDRNSILKDFRKLNNGEKENFNATYTYEYSGPKDFDILVRVVENISFTENGKDNHYNNTYSVIFNEKKKIIDVTNQNDWFEKLYKDSGKTKEIIFSELTKDLIENMQPDVNPLKETGVFDSVEKSSNTEYLMFDPRNAINYALTYSGNSESYYNPNFRNYAGDGGDCMNFASQVIYAGLGGNNHENVLKDTLFANMDDNDGDNWKPGQSKWSGVLSFYNFISSEESKNSGLVAMTWRIEPNQWDLAIDEKLLVGSIALVPGEDRTYEFGHAIAITEANGTTRDMIKYCGHTSNRYQASLSEYAGEPIYIVRPIYYKLTHECAFDGHYFHTYSGLITGENSECIWCKYNKLNIVNKLIAPLTVGDTKTLVSKASMNVFKMSIKVTNPDGEDTWLKDEYNTNFIKRQFVFSKPGMYKITVIAQDTNDILCLESHEVERTYYIRVTDSNSKIGTGESEYVDKNYFDDNKSVEFIPNTEDTSVPVVIINAD